MRSIVLTISAVTLWVVWPVSIGFSETAMCVETTVSTAQFREQKKLTERRRPRRRRVCPPGTTPKNEAPKREVTLASWYGNRFHGRRTASGVRFNQYGLSAAHRTRPLNSRIRVTSLKTGRIIEVPVTDRGPYIRGRGIDLSRGAAEALGIIDSGVSPVVIESVE
jgi:rare lipoprotein A (peptidoglycan hydrolase)